MALRVEEPRAFDRARALIPALLPPAGPLPTRSFCCAGLPQHGLCNVIVHAHHYCSATRVRFRICEPRGTRRRPRFAVERPAVGCAEMTDRARAGRCRGGRHHPGGVVALPRYSSRPRAGRGSLRPPAHRRDEVGAKGRRPLLRKWADRRESCTRSGASGRSARMSAFPPARGLPGAWASHRLVS
jgi:hypothetical protein